MTNHAIDRAQIETVEKIIRPHIRRTPVLEMDGADVSLEATPITLKLELSNRDHATCGFVQIEGGFHQPADA